MVNKYHNSKIVRDIITREFTNMEDYRTAGVLQFLDFEDKRDREYLKELIRQYKAIFDYALRELG